MSVHFSGSVDVSLMFVRRYLMVDVVVNNVMSTSLTPSLSTYMFKEQVRNSRVMR